MEVIVRTSYLDFNKAPCDYTTITTKAELKTIHLSTKRARVVFDNPSKPGRKETSDVPLKNISPWSLEEVAKELKKLMEE